MLYIYRYLSIEYIVIYVLTAYIVDVAKTIERERELTKNNRENNIIKIAKNIER